MHKPLRILIVDDDPGMAETLGDILETTGYEVEIALDGPQALAYVQGIPFDVIFLDIKMPQMNGVELLQRTRRIRPDTVAVMMTAYALPDLIAEALREGAVAVVNKPLPVERMIRFLEELSVAPPILIVDDDRAFGASLQDVMEAHGYAVAYAVDAPEAVEAARRSHPGVVLLDLKLPVRSGYEVLREIRQLDPKATVLLMTGYGQELKSLVEKSLQEGARRCLYKPVHPWEILQHVASARVHQAAGHLRGPEGYAA
jgi:CheY-like chemotaxis protein